jgi:hypothetical protein
MVPLPLDLSNQSGGTQRGASGSIGKRRLTTESKWSALALDASQQSHTAKSHFTNRSLNPLYSNAGGRVVSPSSSYFMDERTNGTSLLSIESQLDPNWDIDKEFLLQVLPPAGPELIEQITKLYPEQFETLPVQVRDWNRWKLYTKFCFFSGLPIGQDEVHYKITDHIAQQLYYGEEQILLSHDIMITSEGLESAELIALPNRSVLRYIRKQYVQQCHKLQNDERIFQRKNWERISPEV